MKLCEKIQLHSFEGRFFWWGKEIYFLFMEKNLLTQSLLYINFSCKMSRNYGRKNFDKENSYETGFIVDRTPKSIATTNGELRKKFDQNLALMEKEQINVFEDNEEYFKPNDVCVNRRDNARRRGFDMKVSNIDTINEKISGLLSMVKKDRQKEVIQSNFNDISQREIKDFGKSPNFSLLDRIKKVSASGKKQNLSPRPERSVSPFGEVPTRQHKRGSSYLQQGKKNQSQRFEKIKMRYLQEEMSKERPTRFNSFQEKEEKSPQVNQWWNQVLKQQDSNKHKEEGNSTSSPILKQKIQFDKMLEERRKNRRLNIDVPQDKNDTKNVHYQHRSAFKPRNENKELTDVFQRAKKQSPIVKVRQECFEVTRNERISQMKIQSPVRKSSSKREIPFSKVEYLQQQGQHRKINSTAKLIDDQLMRIKAKINQSQNNQKKIQSFKPRNNSDQFKTKQHITRIAQNISSQVQFDSHLKPARQYFQSLNHDNKWSQLQQKLSIKGIKLDKRVLKELITIGADEHNPFGAEKIPIQMNQMVQLLSAAEKNWEHCVLHCASSRTLVNQAFQISDLDLNNKGYLSLEDLVCFVNLYVNTFYRNRDLALIMRRLQLFEGGRSKNGIEYSTFMQAFSK